MRRCPMIAWTFVVLLALARVHAGAVPPPASAPVETRHYIAYSLRTAVDQVRKAVQEGSDFRRMQPLYTLGGIRKPKAVFYDDASRDWIMIGETDGGAENQLTLDDWVVALRTRFDMPQTDPGVTIDPVSPDSPGQKLEDMDWSRVKRQEVKFFGELKDTRFGETCCQADWLMKRIALGMEQLPGSGVTSYYDLSRAESRRIGAAEVSVCSRFWFYPMVADVKILDDHKSVVLEQFRMAVFTQILRAEIDGQRVANPSLADDSPAMGFSRSLTEHYDAAARARPVLERLRGLARLAALAKGLARVRDGPDLSYLLQTYALESFKTTPEFSVLRIADPFAGLSLAGGVQLKTLAVHVRGGDITAFAQAVVKMRPRPDALSWEFLFGDTFVPVSTAGLPDLTSTAEMYVHGECLFEQNDYDHAIAYWRQALSGMPGEDAGELLFRIGDAYQRKNLPDAAADYYSRALASDPFLQRIKRPSTSLETPQTGAGK